MNVDNIWLNGKIVKEGEASISVLSHALHYGSAFFEGIRAYKMTDGRTAVFRLSDHMRRLHETTKMYRTTIPYTVEELIEATALVLQVNKLEAAYIRPLVFRGRGDLGLNPLTCPIETMIAAWDWGTYLGDEGITHGIDVQISSWRRLAPDTIPTLGKAAGNYLSSQLIKLEALENGYAEGIALDYHGNISEGSGENIFIVKDNVLYTPPLSASALTGITRHTVMNLARDLNIETREQVMPREFLYIADEVFLSGTAAEITPVRSIDRILVGTGEVGAITKEIQQAFHAVVRGENEMKKDWLYIIA
jgi:branched-chain amino acid aminotransferase